MSGQVNLVADRRRAAGGSRPDVADYTTVALALRATGRTTQWECTAAVRNQFNANAREPDPSVPMPMQIPNDLPLPGRSFYLQMSYRF